MKTFGNSSGSLIINNSYRNNLQSLKGTFALLRILPEPKKLYTYLGRAAYDITVMDNVMMITSNDDGRDDDER